MRTKNNNAANNQSSAGGPSNEDQQQSTSIDTFLLTSARWTVADDMFLDDFVAKHKLPQLALCTRGQYLSIGAPHAAAAQLKPYVLVHSLQTVRRCVATIVRVKDTGWTGVKSIGQSVKTPTEHRLAIPSQLPGYFEILSEDGRPVNQCLASVEELCRKFPEMCLVLMCVWWQQIRQTCKAYTPDADGELRSLYHTRTLHDGEVLTLVGQFNFKHTMFLRCFDEKGSSVYLKMSTKNCRFSAIATKPDSITGVHRMENLILPLTVRQVNGKAPMEIQKIAPSGPLTLQLDSVYEEQIVTIYPLHKKQNELTQLMAVPINTHLKLVAAVNQAQVRRSDAFQILCSRCDTMIQQVIDKVLVMSPVDEPPITVAVQHTPVSLTPPSRSSLNSPATARGTSVSPPTGSSSMASPPPQPPVGRPPSPPVIDDEEIDQLYDYVRGLAPLPESCRVNEEKKETKDSSSNRKTLTRVSARVVRRSPSQQPYIGPTITEVSDEDKTMAKHRAMSKSTDRLNYHLLRHRPLPTPATGAPSRTRPFSMVVPDMTGHAGQHHGHVSPYAHQSYAPPFAMVPLQHPPQFAPPGRAYKSSANIASSHHRPDMTYGTLASDHSSQRLLQQHHYQQQQQQQQQLQHNPYLSRYSMFGPAFPPSQFIPPYRV